MARREKKCLVTGETLDETQLLRIAVAPDDTLVPDVSAKLPGRGMWISPSRDMVDLARKKGLFNRSAGKAVHAPEDLADQFEQLLSARLLNLLGLARRAGNLALGSDAVRISLQANEPVWRIEASDGASDGRRKLDGLARSMWDEVPVLGCFSAEELGLATGRGPVVHGVLPKGVHADSFSEIAGKLSGFRSLDGPWVQEADAR